MRSQVSPVWGKHFRLFQQEQMIETGTPVRPFVAYEHMYELSNKYVWIGDYDIKDIHNIPRIYTIYPVNHTVPCGFI